MARWKPSKGDKYCILDMYGKIHDLVWNGDSVDHKFYNFGNCFPTYEEAEKALEKVKETLLNFHKEQSNG